jgi:hypothetical protein
MSHKENQEECFWLGKPLSLGGIHGKLMSQPAIASACGACLFANHDHFEDAISDTCADGRRRKAQAGSKAAVSLSKQKGSPGCGSK